MLGIEKRNKLNSIRITKLFNLPKCMYALLKTFFSFSSIINICPLKFLQIYICLWTFFYIIFYVNWSNIYAIFL